MPKRAKAGDPVAEIDAQIQQLIAGIDTQIASLQAKKDALLKVSGGAVSAASVSGKRRGRPPGSGKAAKKGGRKKAVSAATREILSQKAKARWAAKKKAATAKA